MAASPNTFLPSSVDEELASFDQLRVRQPSTPISRVLEPSPSISPRLRPQLPSRNTEPGHSSTLQLPKLQPKPRTRSPYARGHLRSHSANAMVAPPMARTRSLPIVMTSSPLSSSPSHSPARPSSPLRPPPTARSSSRRSLEEVRPVMAGPGFTEIESIAEDAELDLSQTNRETPSPLPSFSAAFSRSNSGRGRRRPTSPLYQQSHPPEQSVGGSSPSLGSGRFNEPHPYLSSAASSIPSTPTSIRSRSPSVSSLETIPDSPDAEEEAAEDYHIARLKAAADAADAAEAKAETAKKLREIGLVVPATETSSDMWSPQQLKEKRKRWSVCGAERRGDFEMETIWED